MCGYAHVNAVPMESRRGHQSSRVEILGRCKLPSMGAGNETLALWMSDKHLVLFLFTKPSVGRITKSYATIPTTTLETKETEDEALG